jgi:hypothetical protein
MPDVIRHRVVSPILTTNKSGFVTVPAGSIIETSEDLEQPGLYSVRVDGEELFAFARDIEERTEPIDQMAVSDDIVIEKKS